jgi:hypothetical protein
MIFPMFLGVVRFAVLVFYQNRPWSAGVSPPGEARPDAGAPTSAYQHQRLRRGACRHVSASPRSTLISLRFVLGWFVL